MVGAEGITDAPATSIGDICQIECPACAREIFDLWDLGIPLTSGSTFGCVHCGSALVILTANGLSFTIKEST